MTAPCLIFLLALQVSAIAADTNSNSVLSASIVASTNAPSTATNIAAKPQGPARKDFEAFRVIAQRNIFNPNRTARDGSSRRPGGDSPRPPRSESFTLVGTMLYESGQFAFFDSSSSSYKKVVKAGDSIAGYTVKEVTPNGAKLEAKDKTVSIAVGQKMRKQEQGEWSVSGTGAAADTDSSASTSETTSASGESDTSSASSDEDEAVKRLMKKREEEMKK